MTTLVITCPICGRTVEGEVRLDTVQVRNLDLLISFRNLQIDHDCSGGSFGKGLLNSRVEITDKDFTYNDKQKPPFNF